MNAYKCIKIEESISNIKDKIHSKMHQQTVSLVICQVNKTLKMVDIPQQFVIFAAENNL
jgi:hypothetical protein